MSDLKEHDECFDLVIIGGGNALVLTGDSSIDHHIPETDGALR